MPKIISDEEMKALEDQHGSKQSKQGFISDEEMSSMEGPGPAVSPLVSGVRQFAQGASGNFSDELAGLIEGIGKAGGIDGAGGPMKDIHLSSDGPTLDWETLRDAYKRARDKERGSLAKDSKDNPMSSAVGNIAGMVASPINKIAKGMSLAKGGAILGGINSLGATDKEDIPGMLEDTAFGTGVGFVGGKALDKASPYIAKGAQAVGQKLGDVAEKLAVNATGATGKQASQFSNNAGRELLDRGLVRFGDNAKNIAARTEEALNSAHSDIDSSLNALDAKGVTASADNVVKELQSKISELQKNPSQAGMVKKLQGIVDDIIETGESNVPISAGEQTKRGFNKIAGNWMDPEAGQAGKTAYSAYKNEVERAAEEAAPELAAKFQGGKQTHGLLAPIQEAAERRANTVNQSPFGGLGDMAAMGAGAATGGPIGAPVGFVAKKLLAPRLASSGAVTADKVSKFLLKSPQMADLAAKNPQAFNKLVETMGNKLGSDVPKAASNSPQDSNQAHSSEAILQKAQGTKYQTVLQDAATRGSQAVAAANFVLQGRDPEYRKLTMGEEDDESEAHRGEDDVK